MAFAIHRSLARQGQASGKVVKVSSEILILFPIPGRYMSGCRCVMTLGSSTQVPWVMDGNFKEETVEDVVFSPLRFAFSY